MPAISLVMISTSWTYLNEELVSPSIKCFETLGAVYIIDQHTTICSSVECNTKGLESFLSGSIPKLHSDDSIINDEFTSQEIGTCVSVRPD